MVLTDKQIRNYTVDYKREKLDLRLIENFKEENLQSESYDVTIGNHIAVFKKETKCIDLYEQEVIDSLYTRINISQTGGYILAPNEYILVSLQERINLPNFLTAHIRPRTKYTRLGLLVSDQHCNSTYSGNLQIGLHNVSNNSIKIEPGIRVAQIVFEELKGKPSDEKLYKNKANASYQNEETFIGARFTAEYEKKINDIIDIILEKD